MIYGAPSCKSSERLQKHMDTLILSHPHTGGHMHTPRHTHTHNRHMHYWRWIGKMTDQYAEEKRWVFSFDLREWRRIPDREREFQSTGPKYWKDLSPRDLLPILGTQKMYPRLSEESKKESRDEVTRGGMQGLYKKQCGSRWKLFCIESSCWLVASGDHREKEWCGQI